LEAYELPSFEVVDLSAALLPLADIGSIEGGSQGGDLRNPTMEVCINQRIRRWVFPEPKGGGIVIVKYPFRFSAGR